MERSFAMRRLPRIEEKDWVYSERDAIQHFIVKQHPERAKRKIPNRESGPCRKINRRATRKLSSFAVRPFATSTSGTKATSESR